MQENNFKNDSNKKIFFSHPRFFYNSNLEKYWIKKLKKTFSSYTIINPGDDKYTPLFLKQGENLFLNLIKDSTMTIGLPITPNELTDGVSQELKYSLRMHIPTYIIRKNKLRRIYNLNSFRILSNKETEDRLHRAQIFNLDNPVLAEIDDRIFKYQSHFYTKQKIILNLIIFKKIKNSLKILLIKKNQNYDTWTLPSGFVNITSIKKRNIQENLIELLKLAIIKKLYKKIGFNIYPYKNQIKPVNINQNNRKIEESKKIIFYLLLPDNIEKIDNILYTKWIDVQNINDVELSSTHKKIINYIIKFIEKN